MMENQEYKRNREELKKEEEKMDEEIYNSILISIEKLDEVLKVKSFEEMVENEKQIIKKRVKTRD
jgi:hypothetical protein